MAQTVVAIVQARMGSKRLPGKVLKTIEGKPLIEILFHRLSRSKAINTIILATSEHPENDVLATTVETMGYDVLSLVRPICCFVALSPSCPPI